MRPEITRTPSDPENAAPDWMCVTRGKFKDPLDSHNLNQHRRIEKWNAERDRLTGLGYTQLGKWSGKHGISFKTAYSLCESGILPATKIQQAYWIGPDVKIGAAS